jgi:hypothetical protein
LSKILKLKNTKLNKTVGDTYQVKFTNPIDIQNISTTVLEYKAGNSGIVTYNCDFNNSDISNFDISPEQHLIFDGAMKQDNKENSKVMTIDGSYGAYTIYSASLDKDNFYKINNINNKKNNSDEVLTINGTYYPTIR